MRIAYASGLNTQVPNLFAVDSTCMFLSFEVDCRTEARGIPDVMISSNYISPDSPHTTEREADCQEAEEEGKSNEGVTSSPAWIRKFMKDFLDLRLKLSR